MKILRLWLLLVLAVLVPVRGAIAAAMPCAEEGVHRHAGQRVLHAHEHGLATHGAGEHLHDAAVPTHHRDHDHDGADKCNLCASCCSATPMPTTFAPTIARLDEPAATFPVLQASAPAFVSEGQERPPRSI